jgi:hypothetical protein
MLLSQYAKCIHKNLFGLYAYTNLQSLKISFSLHYLTNEPKQLHAEYYEIQVCQKMTHKCKAKATQVIIWVYLMILTSYVIDNRVSRSVKQSFTVLSNKQSHLLSLQTEHKLKKCSNYKKKHIHCHLLHIS